MTITFAVVMIIVVLFAVLFNQSSRLYFKKANNVGASTIIAQVFAALGALLWTFLFPLDMYMSFGLWTLLLLASVFYALNDRLGADVKKNLDVSVFSLLNKTSDVFLIIISILIFRQVPNIYKVISAMLIIVGQITLSYKKGKFEINKYFIIALITNLIFSIAISIDIGISNEINLPIYVALTLLIPSTFIAIGERIKVSDIKKEFISSNKIPLFITGFSWGTLIVASLYAYQFGSIISVVVINALAVIINVLIGIFIQKEKENLIMKLVAMTFVTIGVLITILS